MAGLTDALPRAGPDVTVAVDGTSVPSASPSLPRTLIVTGVPWAVVAVSLMAVGASFRVNWSCQQPRTPLSPAATSRMLIVQSPCGDFPSKAVSGCWGRNDPANGADPSVIAVAASSSNLVNVPSQLFCPLP